MKVPANNFGILRLVLALLVVLGHFRILPSDAETSGLFQYADFAVDAFFIVSGYLVYASYDRSPVTGSFYIRRFFRIYPLYFIVVVSQGLIMAVLAGGIASHAGDLGKYLAANLVMANFLEHGLGNLLKNLHNPGINPSLWTLKVELAFYLLMPLLWSLTQRFKDAFLIVTYIASSIYVAVCLHYGQETLAIQLPGKLRYFAVGIALYRYRELFPLRLPAALPVLAVAFLLCNFRQEMWLLPVYPLLVGTIVFICALRLPSLPLSRDVSYGVYLFHGPLIQFSLLLGFFRDDYTFLASLVTVALVLAFLAEWAIEVPFIQYGHRLSSLWMKRHEKTHRHHTE